MKNYIISSVITQLSMLILILLVIKNKTSAKSVKVRIITTSVMIMVCDICEFASILLSGTERSAQTAVKLTELLLTPVIPFVLSTAVYPRIPKKVIFYSAPSMRFSKYFRCLSERFFISTGKTTIAGEAFTEYTVYLSCSE